MIEEIKGIITYLYALVDMSKEFLHDDNIRLYNAASREAPAFFGRTLFIPKAYQTETRDGIRLHAQNLLLSDKYEAVKPVYYSQFQQKLKRLFLGRKDRYTKNDFVVEDKLIYNFDPNDPSVVIIKAVYEQRLVRGRMRKIEVL